MRYTFVVLALALSVSAGPLRRGKRAEFSLKNGQDALALNEKFKTLKDGSKCNNGDQACINGGFAQCVGGKFVTQPCPAGTTCGALPLTNGPGTTISCDFPNDITARIAETGAKAGNNGGNNNQNNGGKKNDGKNNDGKNNQNNNNGQNNAGGGGAAGNNGGNNGGNDPQTSNVLDPSVIAAGFKTDGTQDPVNGKGAAPSLTSSNNFINFCVKTLPQKPITNGKQILAGSCNPTPMGLLPAKEKMPSSKFVFPTNFQKFAQNESFTIQMAVRNLETGFFVNAQLNYFAGPQDLNQDGIIKGHSHVTIERITSFTQTTPNDPTKFDFFLGLNVKANNGILTADVTKGLLAGFYKLSSINSAANHQPVLAPVAQHASLDDTVYFEVTAPGAGGNNNGAAGGAAGAPAAAPAQNNQGNKGNKGGKGGKGNKGDKGKGKKGKRFN